MEEFLWRDLRILKKSQKMIHEALYEFDNELRKKHGKILCGVDEAGRGPLAGPVVCAAVVLPDNMHFENLNDSKKISEKIREELYRRICSDAVCYSTFFIDNKEIDKLNILYATMKGMLNAVNSLPIKTDYIIIDGNRVPDGMLQAECIVKGDNLSASIAAASILAKVTRDDFMKKIDKEFPGYFFAKHKGYPTKLHYEMIEKYGITSYHRLSFLKGRI